MRGLDTDGKRRAEPLGVAAAGAVDLPTVLGGDRDTRAAVPEVRMLRQRMIPGLSVRRWTITWPEVAILAAIVALLMIGSVEISKEYRARADNRLSVAATASPTLAARRLPNPRYDWVYGITPWHPQAMTPLGIAWKDPGPFVEECLVKGGEVDVNTKNLGSLICYGEGAPR